MMDNKWLHMIAWVLVMVGGINWLLVGAFNTDLVMNIFGGMGLNKLIYVLIGVGAIYEIVTHKKNCKMCSMK